MTRHEWTELHAPFYCQCAGSDPENCATYGRESRNVTADPERFHLYRLCECTTCGGIGKGQMWGGGAPTGPPVKCPDCRGEGRTRELVATCATPEAVGVALVTLGREGEWDECPVGVLDTAGATGEKWIVRPWLPSPRNISDAGRTLQTARKGKT